MQIYHEPAPTRLPGTVKMVMPLGPQVIYDIEIAGGTAIKISQSRESADALLATGNPIHVALSSAMACHVFPQQSA